MRSAMRAAYESRHLGIDRSETGDPNSRAFILKLRYASRYSKSDDESLTWRLEPLSPCLCRLRELAPAAVTLHILIVISKSADKLRPQSQTSCQSSKHVRHDVVGSRERMQGHSFANPSEHASQQNDALLEFSSTLRRRSEQTLQVLWRRLRVFPSPRHSSVSVAV